MNIDITYIFNYLDKEHIKIDKKEFVFQVKSHPSYPSLIAVVDTLKFFRIEQTAFKLEFSEINHLPKFFVAVLKHANGTEEPFFITHKGGEYFLNGSEKITLSKGNLEKRWTGIVLLIKKNDDYNQAKPNSNLVYAVLLALLIMSFLAISIEIKVNWSFMMFAILPVLGLVISVFLLTDLFKIRHSFLSKICESGKKTSCNKTINPEKYIEINDLGMVYFSFQLVCLFIFFAINKPFEIFTLFKVLSVFVIPIVLVSVFYQKFLTKKWCPLCLMICGILLTEFLFLYLYKFPFSVNKWSIYLSAVILLIILMLWKFLKGVLYINKTYQLELVKTNRVVRNYDVFKNSVLASTQIEHLDGAFSTGNTTSKLQVLAVISPFCGPCQEIFANLHEIFAQHKADIDFHFVLKTNFELNDEQTNQFFRILGAIYLRQGFVAYFNSLKDWFDWDNLDRWNSTYFIESNVEEVEQFYAKQNKWCLDFGINYTPALFLNNYQFPNAFELSSLKYFINDAIEDSTLKL